MRKCYEAGHVFSEEEILDAVDSFSLLYQLYWHANWGLPFFFQGYKADVNSIEYLYELMIDNGPVYAAYSIPGTFIGHIVLVTGVDVEADRVYTNNPWNVRGAQTFSDFLNDFCPGSYQYDSRYQLSAIYIPSF